MVGEHNGRWLRDVTLLVAIGFATAMCGGPTSVASPTSSASAAPTPYFTSSPPAQRENGFARFRGTVTDAATGRPLQDVCIVIATGGSCQPNSIRTDSAGFWWIDLPVNVEWDFAWTKDGYAPLKKHLTSTPGEDLVDVALQPGS